MNGTRVAALFFVALFSSASAEAINIATVPVGNLGNAADFRYSQPQFNFRPLGVGAVGYYYEMGTTEVTNSQYVAFLNAVAALDQFGLYSSSMTSDTRGGIVRSGTAGNFSYAVKPAALGGAY